MCASDLKLALQAQLALTPRLANQLPSILRSTSAHPMRRIPQLSFEITGSSTGRKTTFSDRVIGKRISNQVDD